MFSKNTDLKSYLPFYLREYKEIASLMEIENIEFENLWRNISKIYRNQFIETADEEGIKRYEKIFSIIKKDDEKLEDRRFNLLLKMREEVPYTYIILAKRLEEICGKGMYEINLDYENYFLGIKIALTVQRQFEAVQDLLGRMLPANLVAKVIIMFNSNMKLEKFKHCELSETTHEEIRNKEGL